MTEIGTTETGFDIPSIPKKMLNVTIALSIPDQECDAQAYQTYDPEKMAEILKEQIENNTIEFLESFYAADTLTVDAEVKVVSESPSE